MCLWTLCVQGNFHVAMCINMLAMMSSWLACSQYDNQRQPSLPIYSIECLFKCSHVIRLNDFNRETVVPIAGTWSFSDQMFFPFNCSIIGYYGFRLSVSFSLCEKPVKLSFGGASHTSTHTDIQYKSDWLARLYQNDKCSDGRMLGIN